MATDYEVLFEVLRDALFSPRSYSGRGMGGERCLAFTSSMSTGPVMCDLVRSASTTPARTEVLAQALRGMATDSLGRDETVYYFRTVRE